MNIELKLTKDFERCLDDLRKKYGEDFEFLNGVHPSQLDFSEFIDNFVDRINNLIKQANYTSLKST